MFSKKIESRVRSEKEVATKGTKEFLLKAVG